MGNHQNRFETGILKVVAFIGLVRFVIAMIISKPSIDGYADLYLDASIAGVFLAGLLLIQKKANHKWIIGLFFLPLIGLLWISLYYNDGLISAGEINAYAIIIILSLTIQGRLPWVFVGVFLLGVITVLLIVEQQNLASIDTSVYKLGTYTLLLVTLTNIGITFHSKNVFDSSRSLLNNINKDLLDRKNEIEVKKLELEQQNKQLLELKEVLEEKVVKRTEELNDQKDSVEKYLQLTLTELMISYKKTIKEIKDLESLNDDDMIQMMKSSGKQLEVEVEKLKTRLLITE